MIDAKHNTLRSLVWTVDGGLRLHLGGEVCELNNPGEGFQSIAELLKQPGVSMSAQHLAHMGIGGPAASHGWDRRRNGVAEAQAEYMGDFTTFEQGLPRYDGIGADGAATKLVQQIAQQIRRALHQLNNTGIANELRASILETDQGWEYRGEVWSETVICPASVVTARPKMRRREDGCWVSGWFLADWRLSGCCRNAKSQPSSARGHRLSLTRTVPRAVQNVGQGTCPPGTLLTTRYSQLGMPIRKTARSPLWHLRNGEHGRIDHLAR